VTYAIVDVVTRYWIGYLLSSEQTSTQAQPLFAHALEDQQGAEGGGAAPGRLPVIGSWFAARGRVRPARCARETRFARHELGGLPQRV